MESEEFLFISIFTSLFTSVALWWWLKASLRGLLKQLCHDGAGETEFWQRYTLLMLLIAPLAVVIFFAPTYSMSIVQSIRHLLLSVLLSHFFAFSLVGRTLYKAVGKKIQSQLFIQDRAD